MRRFAMALAVMVFAAAAFSGEVTVLLVIDGDTLITWDGIGIRPGESCMVLHQDEYGRPIPCPDQGHETVIRLIGVDCPEMRVNEKAERDAEEWGVTLDEITKSGLTAKNFVSARIGATVTLETHGLDDYGRTLAYVYLADGRCLNEILLQNGAALAKYRHGRSGEFAEIEREARKNNRGFWKTLWANQIEKGD